MWRRFRAIGASNDFRWKAVTFEGDGVHPKRLHRNHQIEIRALNVTMPHFVHVAQDRVALEQEVLELLSVEGSELIPDLLDPLGIAPILRLRDLRLSV